MDCSNVLYHLVNPIIQRLNPLSLHVKQLLLSEYPEWNLEHGRRKEKEEKGQDNSWGVHRHGEDGYFCPEIHWTLSYLIEFQWDVLKALSLCSFSSRGWQHKLQLNTYRCNLNCGRQINLHKALNSYVFQVSFVAQRSNQIQSIYIFLGFGYLIMWIILTLKWY